MKTLLMIMVLILLGMGCTQTTSTAPIVCNAPYILVGTDCCLDNNNNSICDSHEDVNEAWADVTEDVAEPVNYPRYFAKKQILESCITAAQQCNSLRLMQPGATCPNTCGRACTDKLTGVDALSPEVIWDVGAQYLREGGRYFVQRVEVNYCNVGIDAGCVVFDHNCVPGTACYQCSIAEEKSLASELTVELPQLLKDFEKYSTQFQADTIQDSEIINDWRNLSSLHFEEQLLQTPQIANDYARESKYSLAHIDSFENFIKDNEAELGNHSVPTFEVKTALIDDKVRIMNNIEGMASGIEVLKTQAEQQQRAEAQQLEVVLGLLKLLLV